jgi:NO-binding membrane sensor protein with MHYT domain
MIEKSLHYLGSTAFTSHASQWSPQLITLSALVALASILSDCS